jgi:hypothetical protein
LSRSGSHQIASGLQRTVELYQSAIQKENEEDWKRSAKSLMKHLSREQSSEPYEQLCRLLGILRTKVRLISDCYHLEDRVFSDAKKEFNFLLEKIERKASNKSQENVQHDALSLAFITQLSAEASKCDEKIVFVTGDKVLFESYCDWFYDQSERSAISRNPFIARRVSQYTPILNMSSARSDISIDTGGVESRKAKEIFDSLEEIVMAASMPFASTLPVSWHDDFDSADRYYWKSWLCRSRSQTVSESSFHDKTTSVLQKTREELTFLQNRSSILFSAYMKKRLDERHRSAMAVAGTSTFFDGMQKAVESRIKRLHHDVEMLIQVSDRKNILLLYGLNRSGLHRLPDTILYKVGGSAGPTISDIIKGMESGEKYRNRLSHFNFVDMRAFGAAVALTAYSWSEGRFYALRALELAAPKPGSDKKAHCELIFLACVAERYWLADSLWANYDSEKAYKELGRLLDSLDAIEWHVGRRGVSEKAALHLFVFQCALRDLPKSGAKLDLFRKSVQLLLDATNASSHDRTGAADDQIRHNVASVFVLAALLIGEDARLDKQGLRNEAIGILKILSWDIVQASLKSAELALSQNVSSFLKFESAFFLHLLNDSVLRPEKIAGFVDAVKSSENLGMDFYVARRIESLLEDCDAVAVVQATMKRIYPEISTPISNV